MKLESICIKRLISIIIASLAIIYPAYAVAPDTVTATLTGMITPFSGDISPDGTYVYALSYSGSRIYKINTSNTTLNKTVSLQNSSALREIHFLPNGSSALYLDNTNGTLVKVSTLNDSVTSTASIGLNPYQFSISNDGRYAYVAFGTSTVKRFLTSDLSLDATYTLTSSARYIEVSPNGLLAYAVGNSQIFKINTSTGEVAPSITLSACTATNNSSFTTDGNFLYVSCATTSPSLYKINTATNSVVGSPISIPSASFYIVSSPEGSFMYLTSYNPAAIYRLRLSDDSITATINPGNGPYGVAISSDATFGYSFNYSAGSVSKIYTGAVMAQNVSATLVLIGGGNTAVLRTNKTVRYTISSPASGGDGKITFFQNGKRIAGCISVLSISNVANCEFKPSIRGISTLTAVNVPTSTVYSTSTSSPLIVSVISRTTKR